MRAARVRACSVGHKGKFGHEFLEFEFRPDGLLRYANSSNYKKDRMIRKEGQSRARTPAREHARRTDPIRSYPITRARVAARRGVALGWLLA
jgi:hypothetical protein